MIKDSFAGHTFSILIGRLALPIGAFLILIVIGRISDQLLGEYALVTTYYFVLQTLPLLGLTPFYMRELARNPENAGRFYVSFAAMAVTAAVLINIVITIFAGNDLYSNDVNQAIKLAGLTIVPGILAFLAEITLISLHRSRAISRIALTENALRVVASVYVIFEYGNIVSIIFVLLATRCLSLALYLVALRKANVPWARSPVDIDILVRTRKVAPVFILNTGLALALSRLDFIVLSFFESVEVIGYYAIGYRLFEIAGIVLSAILAAIFPLLSRKFHHEKQEFITLLRIFFPALVLALSVMASVGFQLSDAYVSVLFTNQYPNAVFVSQLFMLLLVIHGIDHCFSQSLNAIDRQRDDTLAMGLGVPVYAGALLTLIPNYGMIGAFAAAAIAVSFQAMLRFWLLRTALREPVFALPEVAGFALSFILMTTIITTSTSNGLIAGFTQLIFALSAVAVTLMVFGLLKPFRALAFLLARDAKNHHDVGEVGALLRFVAHDYLRSHDWRQRKLDQGSCVKNFGFAAVALFRLSRYFHLRGWRKLARAAWQLNLSVTKADLRPDNHIGSGLVLDGPVGIGISGNVGRSATLFAHTGLGSHGTRDIGAGAGLPVVGDGVTLLPRACVLGPLEIEDGWTIGPHAAVFRLGQIRRAEDD